jgi:hypothetical protein
MSEYISRHSVYCLAGYTSVLQPLDNHWSMDTSTALNISPEG